MEELRSPAGHRAGAVSFGWPPRTRSTGAASAARFALAALLLIVFAASSVTTVSAPSDGSEPDGNGQAPVSSAAATPATHRSSAETLVTRGREILLAFYISQPFYDRSDLRLERPDGTDAHFKQLGWDGDALMFPIDGGLRSVEWWGLFGFMVDFLHNKAVARLGFGAHGREIPNPVIDTVEVEGTLKGEPAKSPIKLTDVFKRLEFTHGHNVLLFTPLLRFGTALLPVRPYVGVGGGVAVPHVEVRFPGEDYNKRTNEYQYVGPALGLVAGLEFRWGRSGWFLEYKFSHAWVDADLSGAQSWKNFNLPGDLWTQLSRWRAGAEAPEGRISTTLTAHQAAIGGGYWLQVRKPRPAAAP